MEEPGLENCYKHPQCAESASRRGAESKTWPFALFSSQNLSDGSGPALLLSIFA
jgi:hypothetical protein